MTLDQPIDARPTSYAGDGGPGSEAWIVSGTPADCVKLTGTTICGSRRRRRGCRS